MNDMTEEIGKTLDDLDNRDSQNRRVLTHPEAAQILQKAVDFTNHHHEELASQERVSVGVYDSDSSVVTGRSEREIEEYLEPYVRAFCQTWNTCLPDDEKIFADIFTSPVNGMLGILLYIVKRSDVPTPRMRLVHDSFCNESSGILESVLSRIVGGTQFSDVIDNLIIVVKPDSRAYWLEGFGEMDAAATLSIQFDKTRHSMPM